LPGQRRCRPCRRAVDQHLLVLPAVHSPVSDPASAHSLEFWILAEHADLHCRHDGALLGLVLGCSQAGDQAVTKTAVVLLSGGLDSMVCAAIAREQGYSVSALTIDYNQRHRVELEAARKIAGEPADRQ